jgi:16S rRNA (cytidine1402-2'-O)-methyltransferase
MASGLNGQRFAFNGYLPQRSPDREQRIRELEQQSQRLDQTEIFIEAPYRNDQLFGALLATCRPDTLLCVASDLTGESEEITTKNVRQWQAHPPQLDRRPTIFLLLSGAPRSAQRGTRPGSAH